MLAGRNLRGMVAHMSSLVGGRPHPKLLLFSAALLMTAGFVFLRLARPALYQAMIQEDAGLEWLQAALYAGSAVLSFHAFRSQGSRWHALLALGFLFVTLEELSWGQRLFHLATPTYFQRHNFQQEISVHNLSLLQTGLHQAYILVGAYGAFAWLLVRRPFAPPWFLMPFFLVPGTVYFAITYVDPPHRPGSLLLFRDQEPAEFMLALGCFLWMAELNLHRLTRQVHRILRWWRPADYMRVVLYGPPIESWMQALGPGAAVWSHLPRVCEVLHVEEGQAGNIPRDHRHRTLILPLMETQIATCPDGFARLIPSPESLRTLQNKGAFAAYAQARGLASLCPETYARPEQAVYPCVLKRLDLNNCDGIRIVHSAEECHAGLQQDPWRGHEVLLQEYIANETDHCTHGICLDGRMIWHCTYAYAPAPAGIQRRFGLSLQRITQTAARLAEFEAFLAPLRFTGPVNIDYRIRANGQTAVLEMNPRLGGSLMRPANAPDLRAALAVLLRHAR
jgi:hypothetical protein